MEIDCKEMVTFFGNQLKKLIDEFVTENGKKVNGKLSETESQRLLENSVRDIENQRLIEYPITQPDESLDSLINIQEINHPPQDKNNNEGKGQKTSQLENEIQDLKNQQSSEQSPEAKAENEKKIREKEKELENIKNNKGKQSNTSQQSKDGNFPTKIIIGGVIFIFLGVVVTTFLRSRKLFKKKKKNDKSNKIRT